MQSIVGDDGVAVARRGKAVAVDAAGRGIGEKGKTMFFGDGGVADPETGQGGSPVFIVNVGGEGDVRVGRETEIVLQASAGHPP